MPNLLNLTILNPVIIYWDNLCYKLEQFYYKRGNYYKAWELLLQIGEICVFTKWSKNYCKVGQLLESGTTLSKNGLSITKLENYYSNK